MVGLVETRLPAADGPACAEEAQEIYQEAIALMGRLAADDVAPRAADLDRQGLRFEAGRVVAPAGFDAIFQQLGELGMHGLCVPRSLGGMNCPTLVYFLTSELLARADVSVMTHNGFHGAIATAMLLFSTTEGSAIYHPETGQVEGSRFDHEIGEIVRGEAWGCMDITEPNAGSDMAALTTRADCDDAGNWSVSGQKIFITSGHGKYHFVIARSEPQGRGLAGLSLFLVPAYEDGTDGKRRIFARVERLEEKLGHHVSATCAVSFEAAPAKLVGRRGEGFKQMLMLMNNARLGVGFEALGLCESAYRLAQDYASGRQSMGKSIDKHEIIADYLDQMRTDIQVIRAMSVDGAIWEETALRLGVKLASGSVTDLKEREQMRRSQKRMALKSRRITPLVKYLAGEKAVEMSRRCLQILGGVGYTREYGAEKLLRDALVTPIYEGTSQIQALMAMKDNLQQVIRAPQAFIRRVAQNRWRCLSARDPLERRVARLQGLALAALQQLVSRTAGDKLRALTQSPMNTWAQAFRSGWDPRRDFSHALLHAERLTVMLADVAAAKSLWQQARRHPERRDVLARHLERAEPRCRFLLDEISTTGDRIVARLSEEAQGSAADGPAGKSGAATAGMGGEGVAADTALASAPGGADSSEAAQARAQLAADAATSSSSLAS